MGYVLEAKDEFQRLEEQSTFAKYDYKKELELSGVEFKKCKSILDAGCGSGVVTRFLAEQNSEALVYGCDAAIDRIESAKTLGKTIKNLSFQNENLSALSYDSSHFDAVVCRYVLQHVPQMNRMKALSEIYRCLKPTGRVVMIDFDGPFYNIYPQTPFVAEVLARLETEAPFDLRIGRKLPSMLHDAGFENIEWKIDLIECRGKFLDDEKILIPPKIDHAVPFLTNFLGSDKKAQQFKTEYLALLERPGLVLFYNKFIVTAQKFGAAKLKLVK